MSISYISNATGTNTGTLGTHAAGDLILIFAYRDGSATAPSLPAGFTDIRNSGGSTNSYRIGWKIAAGSSETFGTWSNATSVIAHVYRGVDQILPVSAGASSTGSSKTVPYSGFTLTDTSGLSWVTGFAGHRSTNTNLQNAPTGMTNRSNVADATDEAAGHDTNGGVSSWSTTNVSVGGTSSGYASVTTEILGYAGPSVLGQTVDLTSSTSGTPKATANYLSGNIYMVCVPNGDTPSVSQIKAGQNSSGSAAIADESLSVSSAIQYTFATVTGLTTNTAYDFWFVYNDGTTDSSAVKADFTPTVAPTDTGWLFPTMSYSVTGGGAISTTNITNAYATDGSYATGVLSSFSAIFPLYYGFGANIPAGSTINGLEIRLIAKQSVVDSSVSWGVLSVYDITDFKNNGAPPGATMGYYASGSIAQSGIPTSDTTYTVGSSTGYSSTFWGDYTQDAGTTFTYTPTLSDINNNNFGLAVQVFNLGGSTITASIDSVSIKVHYTPPAVTGVDLDFSITESESISSTFKRTRKVQFTNAEVEALTVTILKKARKVNSSITEIESNSAIIKRLRNINLSITEAEALTISIDRILGLNASISEIESLTFALLKIKGMAASIIEVSAFAANVIRNRGNIFAISELITDTFTVDRNRNIPNQIIENETVNSNIIRSRNISPVIAESEVMTANLARLKQVAFSLAEAFNYTFDLNKFKALNTSVTELETFSFGALRRVRDVNSSINEVLAYAISLSKLSSFSFTQVQIESVNAAIDVYSAFSASIVETYGSTNKLSRKREVNSTIAEFETLTIPMLARLKLIAYVCSETNNHQFWLSRLKKFNPQTITETETIQTNFNRARALNGSINEDEQFTVNFSRLRNQLVSINETQGTDAMLSRLREIAYAIEQTTEYVFDISIRLTDPASVDVTITYATWLNTYMSAEDSTYDLVTRTETMSFVIKTNSTSAFVFNSASSVVIEDETESIVVFKEDIPTIIDIRDFDL